MWHYCLVSCATQGALKALCNNNKLSWFVRLCGPAIHSRQCRRFGGVFFFDFFFTGTLFLSIVFSMALFHTIDYTVRVYKYTLQILFQWIIIHRRISSHRTYCLKPCSCAQFAPGCKFAPGSKFTPGCKFAPPYVAFICQ